MKFRIYLTSNSGTIPYDYAYKLCGAFHRLLGKNRLHNKISLYSLGWLKGKVKPGSSGLDFPKGACWDIGIYNSDIAEQLITGVLLQNVPVTYGMRVRRVERLKPPETTSRSYRFLAGSPVLLRKVEDDRSRTHVTYENNESDNILTRLMRKKVEEARLDIDVNAVNVRFDETYNNPKTKLVDIKGIKNRASVCPVIVEGPPEAQEFAWTVGAGELTGVGFGSLNHTDPLRNGS